MKMAHTIEVNAQQGKVFIDGIVFPYYILENPEIVMIPGFENVSALQLQVLTRNLVVVGSEGEERVITQASDEDERIWAAERGREIVRDGLAEIIASFR